MNRRYILPLVTFIIICLIWDVVVRANGWSVQVFPGPLVAINSVWELITNGTLFKHTVASLYRVTAGFYLAALIGIPLGMILGRIKVIKDAFNPLIQFLRPISPLAWIPLAVIWLGIGDPPAIFLIFMSCFFTLLVSTMIAVESISPIYFQVAANFGFSRYEVITKIVIPAVIPEIVTSLRLTVAIAWLVVVAAEMIAVQSGLGYLILDSRNALRMDYVMVGMITIGAIGLLLDYIMLRLARVDCAFWGSLK
ncbi:MAG: ABC transporter permease [Gammaproteobacteria bacterium]|nr:ABC transporter permease [Gammaproteobacteria bacterium]